MLAGVWPDQVFHVLAHVKGTADIPASVFDPAYVAFCREHLGDAEARTLAEDARVLALLAPDHGELARLQLLAWLGATPPATELDALLDREVARPRLLPVLRERREAVEILRCAVELERPFHARLPPPYVDASEVESALARVTAAAPRLAECDVRLVRALRLRGRIFDREIWVGVPDRVLGPSVEHVSWQAAHEATVAEVSNRGGLGERDVEHAAVVLLAARARRRELSEEHGAWLSHFGKNAPCTEPSALPTAAQNVVDVLLRAEGSSVGHG